MMDFVIQQTDGRSFVFYGDDVLSSEAVAPEDISFVTVRNQERFRSEVWSADIGWYVLSFPEGLLLCSTSNETGVFCRKRSYKFIEMFIDAPFRPKKKREA